MTLPTLSLRPISSCFSASGRGVNTSQGDNEKSTSGEGEGLVGPERDHVGDCGEGLGVVEAHAVLGLHGDHQAALAEIGDGAGLELQGRELPEVLDLVLLGLDGGVALDVDLLVVGALLGVAVLGQDDLGED